MQTGVRKPRGASLHELFQLHSLVSGRPRNRWSATPMGKWMVFVQCEQNVGGTGRGWNNHVLCVISCFSHSSLDSR